MQQRRRFKQAFSLNDRLKHFSDQLKAKASDLRPGPERDALLRKARHAETALNIDRWISSPELQPPK